jgi:HD domain
MNSKRIADIQIPDSKLALEATDLLREYGTPLLINHSLRVFIFGALQGKKAKLKYDSELLYISAVFHDLGLVKPFSSDDERFEVDGANAARAFLESNGVPEPSVDVVWDAIALHTTPGIPKWKKPEVALTCSGVELDVMGLRYNELTDGEREEIVAAFPRPNFKHDIVHAFLGGFAHKPCTCFGNVKSDVCERLLPGYRRPNFVDIIENSPWAE